MKTHGNTCWLNFWSCPYHHSISFHFGWTWSSKDAHYNAATHCSKCLDRQTRKLKKRNRHQKTKQNNSWICHSQELFDNQASFVQTTQNHHWFSFLLLLLLLLVPCLFWWWSFFFLFSFLGREVDKRWHGFLKMKYSVANSLFFEKKRFRLKGNTKLFFFGRLSPHLCFTGYLSS